MNNMQSLCIIRWATERTQKRTRARSIFKIRVNLLRFVYSSCPNAFGEISSLKMIECTVVFVFYFLKVMRAIYIQDMQFTDNESGKC